MMNELSSDSLIEGIDSTPREFRENSLKSMMIYCSKSSLRRDYNPRESLSRLNSTDREERNTPRTIVIPSITDLHKNKALPPLFPPNRRNPTSPSCMDQEIIRSPNLPAILSPRLAPIPLPPLTLKPPQMYDNTNTIKSDRGIKSESSVPPDPRRKISEKILEDLNISKNNKFLVARPASPDNMRNKRISKISTYSNKIEEIAEDHSFSSHSLESNEERIFTDESEVQKELEKATRAKVVIERILDSTYYSLYITIITIYALFFDDIRLIAFQKKDDDIFYGITTFVMACFIVEIILASYAKPHYFNSFFFWLDVVATISLITDIGWIVGEDNELFQNMGGLLKSARAGRATRVARIVRLIRLVRIVKLYKQAKLTKERVKKGESLAQEAKEHILRIEENSRSIHRANTIGSASAGGVQRKSRKTIVGTLFVPKPSPFAEDSINHADQMPTTIINVLPVPTNESPFAATTLAIPEKNKLLSRKTMISKPQGRNASKKTVIPLLIRKSLSTTAMPTLRNMEEQFKIFEEKKTEANKDSKSPGVSGGDAKKSRGSRYIRRQVSNEGYSSRRTMMELKLEAANNNNRSTDHLEIEIPRESRVSKKLSELTTKRVIILILAMLFCLPWFAGETYYDYYTSYEFGLKTLGKIYDQTGNSEDYTLSYNEYFTHHEKDDKFPLIYLRAKDKPLYQTEDLGDLRMSEYVEFTFSDTEFKSAIDQRYLAKFEAWLSIGRTLFICVVLSIGSIFFNSDATTLILVPIERMIEKVKAIARNPLLAQEDMADAGILSAMKKEEEEHRYQDKLNLKSGEFVKKNEEKNSYETDILEKTILKIGRLLALGFGEAGSKIIADNMAKGGDVNPMIPGSKIFAIFGFCDIRKFANVTEALETDVFKFVNQIASIVHQSIHRSNGSANKNLGEAFLLVWKFLPSSWGPDENKASRKRISAANLSFSSESDSSFDSESDLDELILNKTAFDVRVNADLAVFSFIKIIARINQMAEILEYRKDPRLELSMPKFAVSMGFGLHMGWAIEGAIGSYFKIDASYLSPNVNIAARLEAATKQYGVHLLISGEVQELLSQRVKLLTREIDTVNVKGSLRPIHLFTIDLEPQYLTHNRSRKRVKVAKEKRIKNKVFFEKIKQGKLFTADLFTNYGKLKIMRLNITIEFQERFKKAYNFYLRGAWKQAHLLFQRVLESRPKDGPSHTLCNYLDSKNCITPSDWNGCRALTSK